MTSALLLAIACTGPEGPAGADGTDGTDGVDGATCWDLNGDGVEDAAEDINGDGAWDALDCTGGTGTGGLACWDLDGNGTGDVATEDLNGDGMVDVADCGWQALGYVGMAECATCHDDQYQMVIRSGHPYKLVPTGGMAPSPPPEFMGVYPPNPPTGYTWADTTYTIGGWGWKARFVDTMGYVVTSGVAANPVQFNIADGSWSTYHTQDEPGTKPYNCGRCHTTGYSTEGNQDGLPGITGTWAEPGVTCEGCHGPGGTHSAFPELVPMPIVRDAEMCGQCHVRGSPSEIPAKNGFIRHHEQWNEMALSKHRALDCVDCHDPHASAIYSDPVYNPNGGIEIACDSCHFQEAATMNTVGMANTACTDCHMPPAAKSALGDLANFTGDITSHTFAINTDVTAPQFYDMDTKSYPYLTVDYACRWCHQPDGMGLGLVKTDAELSTSAIGFHTP